MSTTTAHHPRAQRIWGETWRLMAALITGGLLLAGVLSSNTKGYESGSSTWLLVDIALGLLSLVLLTQRRRWPFFIALLLALFTIISAGSVGAAGIAFISCATHRDKTRIAILAVVTMAAGLIFSWLHPTSGNATSDTIANLVIGVLAIAFCVATGAAIGARRELVASLRERLEAAQSEDQARTEQARVAERARIAREMHDVLAHRISLVAMHSGALAYRTNLTADEVRESSIIIRDNAQHALAELREVLGVLRTTAPSDSERATITTPQPSLQGLAAAVADLPDADGPTNLRIDGNLDLVPDTLSRNVFRVVQECLTNRRKHAPGTPIEITIAIDPINLTVRSRNAIAVNDRRSLDVPHSGLGLIGLRERANLSGGELSFGTDRAGDFVVRASFPMILDAEETA